MHHHEQHRRQLTPRFPATVQKYPPTPPNMPGLSAMTSLTVSEKPSSLSGLDSDTNSAAERPSILELTPPSTPTKRRARGAPPLPMEIVVLILEYVPPSRQDVFAAACRVCRMWYWAGVGYL